MATSMIYTPEQLNALPNRAVVYDSNDQVWQKLAERDHHVWFRPGETAGSRSVALPARLLDDGL